MTDNAFDDQNANSENADNMAYDNESPNKNFDIADDAGKDTEVEGVYGVENETIEKLEAELAAAKDKYLRLLAEFDNFKKRNDKEKYELRQTAGKDIIQSLLVVMDDSERATRQMESSTDLNAIKEGVSLVFNKLRTILQQRGLKPMDSAGQEFNPDLHEAITEIPAPNEGMAGKILDVIEPGYYLNDKLIRHAKVIVGK